MKPDHLGLGARLALFLTLPWRLLFDGALAARLAAAASKAPLSLPESQPQAPEPPPAQPPATPAPAVIEPETAGPDYTSALQLLALLQREGRLVDFLEEDVAGFSDAEIGAAARVVHDGCRRTLSDYLELAPIRTEPEGAAITLPTGFDAHRHRLTGNLTGEPPYTGALAHPGWQVKRIELPTLSPGHDAHIVAPAEVELR